jgi:hypothetical protein
MPPRKDRRQHVRSLWDARHPLWTVLQGVIALGLVLVAGDHLEIGAHHGGVDGSDVAGLSGMALAGKLAWQFFKNS